MLSHFSFCSKTLFRVRATVAERIEREDVPSVQIREKRQVKTKQEREPDR